MGFLTAEHLGRLLDEHAQALELYAAQWTDSPADAVQEAFLELIGLSAEPDRVVAWLYRVVRNRSMNSARSARRRKQRESQAAGAAQWWFEPTQETDLDAEWAAAEVRRLPPHQREVIVARIWGGLGYQEIAEVTGVSVSTAHRRYEAGLRALRERLDGKCGEKKEKNESPSLESSTNSRGTCGR